MITDESHPPRFDALAAVDGARDVRVERPELILGAALLRLGGGCWWVFLGRDDSVEDGHRIARGFPTSLRSESAAGRRGGEDTDERKIAWTFIKRIVDAKFANLTPTTSKSL